MYLKSKNNEIIIRKSDSKLLCKKIITALFLSVVLHLILLTSALAQETYTLTTFNGNIEAKDDSIAIIDGGESVTMKPTIPHDTFDGTVLDTKKWEKIIWNSATVEQDSKLIISTSKEIASSSGEVKTRYQLLGDFEIQVDFEIGEGWSRPPSDHIGVGIGIEIDGWRYNMARHIFTYDYEKIILYSFKHQTVLADVASEAKKGKFKITRNDSKVHFNYNVGSGWFQLAEIDISKSRATVALSAGGAFVKHAFTAYFDNFKINSGVTNYRSEASMRMVAYGFTNTVLIDSLKVDAALPLGSMLTTKFYVKENLYPNWKLLGDYQFDHDTKKVAISTPASVDSVRYGLTGSEGISFITNNTDSLPILHSITLKTRLEENSPEVTVIQSTPNSAEKWDIYELTLINRDTYANPFWDVSITGKFTGPNSQEIIMEGFYYDTNTWKIRFSPTQEGTWDYIVRFTTSKGSFIGSGTFTCTHASLENHGFITISERNPYAFSYGDENPFIPIGAYTHTPAVTAAFLGFPPESSQVPDMWKYLAENHSNTYRLHIYHQTMFTPTFSWNTLEGHANLLANSGGLDRYNLTDAKLIDRWLKQTKDLGINWFMCLMAIHDVSAYPFTACYWSNTLGGPFPNLDAVYSTYYPDGLELVKKYMHYVVNRYAAFRNIFVWEYNNEWGAGTTVEWIEAIDEVIDQADPYQRAHTVSFWNFEWSRNSNLYDSPSINVTDDHCYPRSGFNDFTVDSLVQYEALYRYQKYQKPVVFGEFGLGDDRIPTDSHDYERIGYWSSFVAGGNALIWIYGKHEGVEYNKATIELLNDFYSIIARIKDYPAMSPQNELVSVTEPSNLRSYCLASDKEFLVYVHHYSNHSTTMHDKTLSITLPVSQYYQGSWFDPAIGQLASALKGATGNGTVMTTIPDFVVDLVLYLRTSSNFPLVLTKIPDISFLEDDTLTLNLASWYSCVEDPDDPDSTLNWVVQGSNNVFASVNQSSVNFFARQNWFGFDTLSIIVSDEEFSDTTSLIVNVKPINDAPIILPLPDTTMSYNDTLSINLNEFVADVDDVDTTLTWSAVSSNDSLFVTIDQDNRARFTALRFIGKVAIEFTVCDDSLAEDRDTLFVTIPSPTSVSDDQISQLPTEFSLFQNYPNPFNIETVIKYELPKPCQVSLKLYNCLGEEIAMLVESYQAADRYKVVWQADGFSSGIYFARLQAGEEYIMVRKFLLLK